MREERSWTAVREAQRSRGRRGAGRRCERPEVRHGAVLVLVLEAALFVCQTLNTTRDTRHHRHTTDHTQGQVNHPYGRTRARPHNISHPHRPIPHQGSTRAPGRRRAAQPPPTPRPAPPPNCWRAAKPRLGRSSFNSTYIRHTDRDPRGCDGYVYTARRSRARGSRGALAQSPALSAISKVL